MYNIVRATNWIRLIKKNVKCGLPNSELAIPGGMKLFNNGNINAIVTRIFWINSTDAKYKSPMVNFDFISLYVFQ